MVRVETNPGKTVLLTLGRLPVALDIARSFHAIGWRVLVAETSTMHLCRMSNAVARCLRVTSPVGDSERYLADIRNIATTHEVDLIVPVSEESMYVAALHDDLPGDTRVFCMPQTDMLALHDKYRFARTAEKFGLRVPESGLADDPAGIELAAHHDFVLKPRYSSSGRGVSYHAAGTRVEPRGDIVIQRRVDGCHYSSFAIAREGSVLASAVYRGSVTDGSVAVCFERVDDMPAIDEWCAEFVARSCHTGFISFDFIAEAGGSVLAIECNPRATSGIHFLSAAALASLVLGQVPAGPVQRPVRHLTESYSCFTTTLGSLFSGSRFRHNLSRLRRATDVTWSTSDPWPYLLMMINTYRILAIAASTRSTFAVAAVLDIEWHEPRPEASGDALSR